MVESGTQSREPGRPILVTGAHRSGTTWVGKILAASPCVHYIQEPFNPSKSASSGISTLRPPTWCWEPVGSERDPARRALSRTLQFRYAWLPALLEARSPRDLRRIRNESRGFRLARRNRSRPLVKDPIALFAADWLATQFAMQVVVMIRHPAGFAASLKRLDWDFPFSCLLEQAELMNGRLSRFEAEIRDFARERKPIIDQAALVWKLKHYVVAAYRTAHPEWTFLRNEDLSLDPLSVFRDLFDRLQLPFTDAITTEISAYTSAHNPRDARDGVVLDLRRNSVANVSAWSELLTADEIARVRRGIGEIGDLFYGAADW